MEYAVRDDITVLALPRGGVPVGREVAEALSAPLDVFIVRKLGVPGQEELAFGAIAPGGVIVFNESVLHAICLPEEFLNAVIKNERLEMDRREQIYRKGKPRLDVEGKVVIIVDDGLATGSTIAAAVKALKGMQPAKIVVAVPVASMEACQELEAQSGVKCICAATPEPFYGVGMWYEDFSQVSDREVQEVLTSYSPRKGNLRTHNKGAG
jgi:predicted phosphoribosyltransferase